MRGFETAAAIRTPAMSELEDVETETMRARRLPVVSHLKGIGIETARARRLMIRWPAVFGMKNIAAKTMNGLSVVLKSDGLHEGKSDSCSKLSVMLVMHGCVRRRAIPKPVLQSVSLSNDFSPGASMSSWRASCCEDSDHHPCGWGFGQTCWPAGHRCSQKSVSLSARTAGASRFTSGSRFSARKLESLIRSRRPGVVFSQSGSG